jgi:hypothetical protein
MGKGFIINKNDLAHNGWIFVSLHKGSQQKWEKGGQIIIWEPESQEIKEIFYIG